MNEGRRIVFDLGALLGAALRPSSAAEGAFLLALRHGVICLCEPSLEGLYSILSKSKLDRCLAKRARLAFVDLLRSTAWICQVSAPDWSAVRPRCHSRRNNIVLALAAAAEADVIVSVEDELLARKAWHRIPIVTPAEFQAQFDQA